MFKNFKIPEIKNMPSKAELEKSLQDLGTLPKYKFNIGDEVKYHQDIRYKDWHGVVVERQIECGTCMYMVDGSWWFEHALLPTNIRTVAFNIGDKVKCFNHYMEGHVGEVVRIDFGQLTGEYMFEIKFKKVFGTTNTCWIYANNLELVQNSIQEKPKENPFYKGKINW